MAQYRKKPIVIDAVQWFKHGDHPEVKTYPEDLIRIHKNYEGCGYIETLEDSDATVHHVIPTNWIMGPGAGGEYWAIQNEIFEKTYEKV